MIEGKIDSYISRLMERDGRGDRDHIGSLDRLNRLDRAQ